MDNQKPDVSMYALQKLRQSKNRQLNITNNISQDFQDVLQGTRDILEIMILNAESTTR